MAAYAASRVSPGEAGRARGLWAPCGRPAEGRGSARRRRQAACSPARPPRTRRDARRARRGGRLAGARARRELGQRLRGERAHVAQAAQPDARERGREVRDGLVREAREHVLVLVALGGRRGGLAARVGRAVGAAAAEGGVLHALSKRGERERVQHRVRGGPLRAQQPAVHDGGDDRLLALAEAHQRVERPARGGARVRKRAPRAPALAVRACCCCCCRPHAPRAPGGPPPRPARTRARAAARRPRPRAPATLRSSSPAACRAPPRAPPATARRRRTPPTPAGRSPPAGACRPAVPRGRRAGRAGRPAPGWTTSRPVCHWATAGV